MYNVERVSVCVCVCGGGGGGGGHVCVLSDDREGCEIRKRINCWNVSLVPFFVG